ncbi:MAG TPA: hypothetical protein VNW71_15975 [Thermoanaerobaculia bacterium]|nr:hypothetical protein [Thermoanaerobaculia bacterium]
MEYGPAAFANPTKECDVIMKGGITSGVVYPLAVTELAKTYRLKNIGGTSAGAIAAALAAAAELGRNNPQGGFQKLAELPGFLAKNLKLLFQPSPTTRPAFSVLLTWISPGKEEEQDEKPGKLARFLAFDKKLLAVSQKLAITALKLVFFHPIAFLIGALLGIGLFWLVADFPSEGQLLTARAMPLRVFFALFWGLLAALAFFAWRAVKAIQDNAFGMCSGMPAHEPAHAPALTPWLAGLIDETAGKTGEPLTFGDLWGPGDRKEQEKDARLRAVNLEVMTTNLTHGRPMRIPFSSRELFFNPEELRRFFPKEIVKWMLDHPFPTRSRDEKELIRRIEEQTPYRPMPAPADLPVVVAARMSLSFPVLISAIPLYAVDWSLKENQRLDGLGQAPIPGRCWFSDGGIGSNFPVHFFDGLLPSRPTFGINLRPFHPDFPKNPDEGKNVWRPSEARQGILPTWTEIQTLTSFLLTIINTMQNWVDNTQMRLPGYRDRVVHVHLTDDEGGMNLEMPEERIRALTARGEAAGRLLQELNWDGHRWARYLTAMSQLESKLGRMREVYLEGFRDFLVGYNSDQKPYRHSDTWKEYAVEATDGIVKTVEAWGSHEEHRLHDPQMPHPEPDLRILPRQ